MKRLMELLSHRPEAFVSIFDGASHDVVIECADQNVLDEFISKARQFGQDRDSPFVTALALSLEGETYDAGWLLFHWVNETENIWGDVRVIRNVPPQRAGYPVYELRAPMGNGQVRRLKALVSAFNGYARSSGNELARILIMEAFGLALSRCLGKRGKFRLARRVTQCVLELNPGSVHVKAADFALQQAAKSVGDVPARLRKFIGDDDGYMKRYCCKEPFIRFDIGPSGDVLLCCGHYLPKVIGNIENLSVESVLNSDAAQKIRRSIVDGSYKYCNHLDCNQMAQECLPLMSELDDAVALKAIETDDYRVDGIGHMIFGYDQSCNLACPSCRSERIAVRSAEFEKQAKEVGEKIIPILPKTQRLYLNPAGEFLVSKVSRHVLRAVSDGCCPNLEIDLITNGTLFTPKEWAKFPGIHGKIKTLRVSIDAATKETFEQIRKFGVWETLVKNLEFIAALKRERSIEKIYFSFTYQKDNYKEMKDFLVFAKHFECDYVMFEVLQNLGAFSAEEFKERAVHLETHPEHAVFLKVISDPEFYKMNVIHDFRWDAPMRLSEEDVRFRYNEMRK